MKIRFVAMAGDPSGAGRTDEMVDEVRESPSPYAAALPTVTL